MIKKKPSILAFPGLPTIYNKTSLWNRNNTNVKTGVSALKQLSLLARASNHLTLHIQEERQIVVASGLKEFRREFEIIGTRFPQNNQAEQQLMTWYKKEDAIKHPPL